MSSKTTVFVNEFTNGLLDPSAPMLGPVRDGGNIVANTAAGCWGPMITPALRGGHEVTKPVYVEGVMQLQFVSAPLKLPVKQLLPAWNLIRMAALTVIRS